jgi:hypothetical protein
MTVRAFRHLETTTPVIHTCRRCGRPIVYGLAEGIPVRADLTPLVGALAEPLAMLEGRQTYTLRLFGLVHRDAGRRADPTLSKPVLAEHACPRRNT